MQSHFRPQCGFQRKSGAVRVLVQREEAKTEEEGQRRIAQIFVNIELPQTSKLHQMPILGSSASHLSFEVNLTNSF